MGPSIAIWGDRVYVNHLFKQGHAKIWYSPGAMGSAVFNVRSKWHTTDELSDLRDLAERHVKALADSSKVPDMATLRKLAQEQAQQ